MNDHGKEADMTAKILEISSHPRYIRPLDDRSPATKAVDAYYAGGIAKTSRPLTADDPRVVAFLKAWHESGRADFERWHTNLVYDDYAPKTAKERRKYLALDRGTSGMFLVDRTTLEVYSIKAYGVPNRRLGTLEELTDSYRKERA